MWNTDSGTWQVIEDLKFVSDPLLFGRHVVELNATDNALVRSYVWGLDLSGTMDGAGGVGGLLWVTLHTASGAAAGPHFAAYDGNGNVVGLVSATTGTETARYEYGPFAEPIRLTGPAASQNPFRFSTKRTCNTTDLALFEYRAYSPSLGRWVSRDPIGELVGANVNIFVMNSPVATIDVLGLKERDVLWCYNWCDEAVRFCRWWLRKRATEWCYTCCLAVGERADSREYKRCVAATAAGCCAGRVFSP